MMSTLDEPDAILITGPTASGKSALALELAARHGGEVINADSMQVYDTLRVLTARPSRDDMAGIPHHLYGHVPAVETCSTGAWLRAASERIAELRASGHLPVIVGGTGLYFRALTGGLSDMPSIPDDLRQTLRAELEASGVGALHARLRQVDPESADRLQPADAQRILRALEVHAVSGRSIRDFASAAGPVVIDPARARKIVVLPDRSVLARRIDSRFEAMLEQGAIEEVEALLSLDPPDAAPVMKAIGVRQIAAMLAGELTRRDVIELASAATRQYAKRQMTWFRNQMDESWQRFDPASDRL